jgi:hypothetical protein
MTDNINKFILKALKIAIVISFFIFTFYFSLSKEASGDEFIFLKDLRFIQSNGWFQAISSKISVTYLILAYPLTYFVPNYIALRLINFLLFFLLLFYFNKYGNIKNQMFYYYFLFYSQIGWFVLGTNDALFVVSMVIFINEVYKFLETKTQFNNSILYSSLILAFFTRELILVYLPIVIIAFYFLKKNSFNFSRNIKFPIVLIIFMVFINIPSIISNNTFSYDNKIPPQNVKSSWSQRQYLARLMVNNGSLNNGSHPTWEQTDDYLKKNGIESLPNSIFKSIFFNLELTFITFFKNLFSVILPSIRQTGLIVFTLILLLFKNLFNKKLNEKSFIPLSLFLMIIVFSLIIISYIELRWLIPVFIMSLIYFSDIEFNKKLPKIIFSINYLVMFLMIFYGTYRVLIKF